MTLWEHCRGGNSSMIGMIVITLGAFHLTENTDLNFRFVHWPNGRGPFFFSFMYTGLIECHLWNWMPFNDWNLDRSGTCTKRSFKWNKIFSIFWVFTVTRQARKVVQSLQCFPETDVLHLISNFEKFRNFCRMESALVFNWVLCGLFRAIKNDQKNYNGNHFQMIASIGTIAKSHIYPRKH